MSGGARWQSAWNGLVESILAPLGVVVLFAMMAATVLVPLLVLCGVLGPVTQEEFGPR